MIYKPEDKEIKISVLMNLFVMFLRVLILGYLSIFFVKNLTVTEYGYFTTILSLLLIFEAFSDLGLGVSSSRMIAKNLQKNENIGHIILSGFVLKTITISICLILIILFSKIISVTILKTYELRPFILLSMYGFVIGSYYLFICRILQGLHRSSYQAYGIISDIFVYFFSSIILVYYFKLGVRGSVIGYNLGKIIGFLFLLVLLFHRILPFIKFNFNKSILLYLIKEISKYAVPLSITTMITVLFTQLPILMINKFSCNENVAYYGLSSRIIYVLLMPAQAMMFSYSASLAYFKEHSHEIIGEKLSKLYTSTFFINLPISIFIFFLSKPIILIVFSSKYLSSIIILKILSIMILTGSLARVSNSALGFLGHPYIESISNVMSTIVLIVLGSIMLIHNGIIGLSIAVILASTVNFIISSTYVIMKYRIFFYLDKKKIIVKSLLCFLVLLFLFLLSLFVHNNLELLISSSIIFSAVFILINIEYLKRLSIKI